MKKLWNLYFFSRARVYNNNKKSYLSYLWQAIVSRKILVLSFLVLIIALPLAYLSYRYQAPLEAAWMDDNWTYRQTVALTNAGTAQTNY